MADTTTTATTAPTCYCGEHAYSEYGERCPSCPSVAAWEMTEAYAYSLARLAARCGRGELLHVLARLDEGQLYRLQAVCERLDIDCPAAAYSLVAADDLECVWSAADQVLDECLMDAALGA